MTPELGALIGEIARVSGLLPRGDWTARVSRALDLAAGVRATTAEALVRNRHDWASLMPDLLDAVTVRETFFFRHREHFDFLVEEIGTRLKDAPDAALCILSAGCASGEEPYSGAIAIHAKFGADALSRVRILATDISPEAIRKARAGEYGAWAFRDAPSWLSHGYFQRCTAMDAQIVDIIRNAVTFEVSNVLHHAAALPREYVDFIFFRNVAIYLDPAAVAEVYSEFHRILKPNGVLVVAPGDPRPSTVHFIDVGHESTSIYRSRVGREKPDGAVAGPRRTASAHALPPAATVAQPKRPQSLPQTSAPFVELVRSMDVTSAHRNAEAEALRIADMGDLASVHATIASLCAQSSTAPTGYLIRAHLSLDSGQPDAAVEDLRRVLFLRPEHRLARYWYVLALQAAGQITQAMTQGRQLKMALAQSRGDTILEDGETSTGQLLDALEFVKEGLS